MGGNFKSSFWMSIIGHFALFVLILSYAIFSDFFKKELPKPEPFTLMPAPSEKVSETPQKKPQPEAQVEEIKINKIKPLKEIELPPTPEIAEQPEPEPQPKPEKPKPQTVKDSNKAKPTPPKRVSAEDFFKNRKPLKTTKKPQPKPKKPVFSPVKTTQNLSIEDSRASSAQVSASDAGQMSSYESEVYALLRRHWVLPEECAGMDLSVAVSFTINSNGRVSNFRILKSSGERVFDNSVEKVLKAVVFRSPPRGKPVSLAINFRAEDEL